MLIWLRGAKQIPKSGLVKKVAERFDVVDVFFLVNMSRDRSWRTSAFGGESFGRFWLWQQAVFLTVAVVIREHSIFLNSQCGLGFRLLDLVGGHLDWRIGSTWWLWWRVDEQSTLIMAERFALTMTQLGLSVGMKWGGWVQRSPGMKVSSSGNREQRIRFGCTLPQIVSAGSSPATSTMTMAAIHSLRLMMSGARLPEAAGPGPRHHRHPEVQTPIGARLWGPLWRWWYPGASCTFQRPAGASWRTQLALSTS